MGDGRLGRRALLLGGAAVAVAGVLGGGYELVEHGILPGRARLDEALGREAVEEPDVTWHRPGPAVSGTFRSAARNTEVGWTISYPPGHGVGDRLPLVLGLHGYGGSHARPIGPIAPVQLLAASLAGTRLPPMAVAAADGGPGYWHAHPGDDPMRMLLDELLPLCAAHGLDTSRVGLAGVSMGGYGALLLAEQHPQRAAAVAAIGPAIWTTYGDALRANRTAFTSAADFASHDVTAEAPSLAGIPVRVTSGRDDPFHPFVETFVRHLPAGALVSFPPGVHDSAFFASQAVPSLAFLGQHLA